MQLNFAGLLILALGIVLLGLGISGNYATFGSSLKAGVKRPANKGGESTPGRRE